MRFNPSDRRAWRSRSGECAPISFRLSGKSPGAAVFLVTQARASGSARSKKKTGPPVLDPLRLSGPGGLQAAGPGPQLSPSLRLLLSAGGSVRIENSRPPPQRLGHLRDPRPSGKNSTPDRRARRPGCSRFCRNSRRGGFLISSPRACERSKSRYGTPPASGCSSPPSWSTIRSL